MLQHSNLPPSAFGTFLSSESSYSTIIHTFPQPGTLPRISEDSGSSEATATLPVVITNRTMAAAERKVKLSHVGKLSSKLSSFSFSIIA